VAAQATQTKETVPGVGGSEMTMQVKGQLVAKGSNWLIAKDPAGGFKVYTVQPDRQAIVDGVPQTLAQLELGTMQAEAQAQQAAGTQDAGKKETFKKAWGACLEGRGYSVK
jgi:hypothetical protein